MKKIALVISCEHAVDTVPEEYLPIFQPFNELLNSHRGIDFGALTIAKHLKETLPCDFVQAHTTRLLIDCNRSLNRPSCFSEITTPLPQEEKIKIIEQYYRPFREQVINLIQKNINQKLQVWHLSIHSFTPVMNNIIRNTDIGFLYNPQRSSEKSLCESALGCLSTRHGKPTEAVSTRYCDSLAGGEQEGSREGAKPSSVPSPDVRHSRNDSVSTPRQPCKGGQGSLAAHDPQRARFVIPPGQEAVPNEPCAISSGFSPSRRAAVTMATAISSAVQKIVIAPPRIFLLWPDTYRRGALERRASASRLTLRIGVSATVDRRPERDSRSRACRRPATSRRKI